MIDTTVTPADVAELAEILVEDVKAYADKISECGSVTGYEVRMTRWMLATAAVRYTDDMVMIRITRRGRYATDAYFAASALLDGLIMANRTDGLGTPGNDGMIVEIDANTWALKY